MNGTNTKACLRVRAHLCELVDGALAPLEEARDRGHLEACVECAQALQEHEHLLGAVRRAARVPAAEVERVVAGVLEALPAAPPRRASRLRLVPALFAAAAAVLFLLLLRSGVAGPSPRVDLASLEPVLQQLPGWNDVLSGLDYLARMGS
jgi:anti-sigma factor RsiW